MHEIVQASGYAALVYLIFHYLVSFGSGRPLDQWINPGRKFIPILVIVLLLGAFTLLERAVHKYGNTHTALLVQLVNEERAQSEIVGAMSFVVFALALMILYLWCWWNLPRDPRTFNNNPKHLVREYTKALKHYVRWKGGIDYAILCEVRAGVSKVIAEGSSDKDVLRGLYRIPEVPNAEIDADPVKAVTQQKQLWQKRAEDLYVNFNKFDEMVLPIRQGHNVAICFDVKYGAFYIEMLDRPEGPAEKATALYLFAVTLNEHEVAKMNASKHFYALSEAVRYIRSGVTKG